MEFLVTTTNAVSFSNKELQKATNPAFDPRNNNCMCIKYWYEYPHTDRYTYKSYRVFASSDLHDGRLLRAGGKRGKPEKFGNTPDHCRIFNEDMTGVKVPAWLDRGWYIDMAKKRLKAFGVKV